MTANDVASSLLPDDGAIERPLVSVIMPAHNAERFLAEAVASVQAQTYPQWELILLDDASTDGTASLMATMAGQNDRIKPYYLSAQGSPAKVRNCGLREAKGSFIGFLDADDRYRPDALANLLAGYQQYPNATAVYGFADLMNEAGQSTEEGLRLVEISNPVQPEEIHLALPTFYSHDWAFLLKGGLSCMLPGLLLKKSTLDRVGLFNEEFIAAEDYQFYMRLLFDAPKNVHALPHYVYQYRVYGTSLTKTMDKAQAIVNSVLAVMNWIFDHPQLPAAYQPMRAECLTHCYRYLIRERILNNQPTIARHMITQAYNDTQISKATWAKLCLPLLIRSFLPYGINSWLRQRKERSRLQQEQDRLMRSAQQSPA
jgi:glycosyltransferase involved in cell wall biosynthesis